MACHHSLVKPGMSPVYYSDARFVNLLPTSAMTSSIDGPEHLVGTFTNADGSVSKFEGDTWVQANDTVLTVMVFSGFGTTVAELTYTSDSLSLSSSIMDVKKMKAEYVLADFQACFYPYEALKKNFETAGFEFTEHLDGENFERTLSESGKVILHIRKTGNEIDLSNELRHYGYHITLGEK